MKTLDTVKTTIQSVIRGHAFRLKLFISGALLFYCSRFINVEQLYELELAWHWLALAWVLILIDYVVGAVRFKALAESICQLNLFTHIKYYFWSGFFNAALPSSIGGDAMRMIWLKRDGLNMKAAISLVLVERVLGVLTLLLIAGFGALLIDVPSILQTVINELWLWLAGGATACLGLILTFRDSSLIQPALNSLRNAFAELGLSQVCLVFVWSLIYQVITVTATICVAKSIALELNAAIWFFIVPLVWLLTVIPISVGGLGVREIGFVFLLGTFGEFNEQAVVLGLLSFLVYLLGGLVGGAWYLYDDRNAP